MAPRAGFLDVFLSRLFLGAGATLALPPTVAFAAPVVQAVAVSAGGGSRAGVLGGNVLITWFYAVLVVSLLWSPGPRPSPVFRFAICDCLSLNVPILFWGKSLLEIFACQSSSAWLFRHWFERGHSTHHSLRFLLSLAVWVMSLFFFFHADLVWLGHVLLSQYEVIQ